MLSVLQEKNRKQRKSKFENDFSVHRVHRARGLEEPFQRHVSVSVTAQVEEIGPLFSLFLIDVALLVVQLTFLIFKANHEQLKLAEAEEVLLQSARSGLTIKQAYLRALNLEGVRGTRIGYTDGTTPGWIDTPQLEEIDIGQVIFLCCQCMQQKKKYTVFVTRRFMPLGTCTENKTVCLKPKRL